MNPLVQGAHLIFVFYKRYGLASIEFSALLAGLAAQSGLPERALAEKAQLTRQELYSLLHGNVGDVTLSTIARLAFALDVPPMELLKPYFNDLNQKQIKGLTSEPKLGTGFVADITYPDNSLVYTGQTFEKVWSVLNLGNSPWQNLYLECQDEEIVVDGRGVGLQAVSKRVAIPETQPGQKAFISVQLQAPVLPCSAISRWKAVDEKGRLVFPDKSPLYCMVKVVGL
jgi:DNA-binding Xre family transcriptional regulator